MLDRILKTAYADLLGTYPWDLYAILTFNKGVSFKRAWRLFHKWKSEIKRDVGCPIDYVLVTECRWPGDSLHFHVLLAGTGNQQINKWKQQWWLIAGWSKIIPYDPSKNARYYIGEKVALGNARVYFSRTLNSRLQSTVSSVDSDDFQASLL